MKKLIKLDFAPATTEVILLVPLGTRLVGVEKIANPNVVRVFAVGDPAVPTKPLYVVALQNGGTIDFSGDLEPVGRVLGIVTPTFVFQGVLAGISIDAPISVAERDAYEAEFGVQIPDVYTNPAGWISVT